MSEIVNYQELIRKLEDSKWDLIAKHGQSGVKLWPPIDAKLDKLYKWWVKAIKEGVAEMPRKPINHRVIKAQ